MAICTNIASRNTFPDITWIIHSSHTAVMILFLSRFLATLIFAIHLTPTFAADVVQYSASTSTVCPWNSSPSVYPVVFRS
ncbi:uncharacterized protein STEHIDRAFT_163235 [Stereum hirsutum FP-91666 SS1]|uniref:Uncharacterized protein n=1 Tax=Stereum hirsutum (strain FP-91666) TaxID=721885 RepID=R7RX69_STEHR|nr:uncharacterized protein STEHIDRAFT_163235 [Stereum hirsutum FP-91666 SS1]EIM79981.1 hypothetical protein STEHIDRAFT_163235 [Stereum hirsutum FP-91666 SS1]